MPYALAAELVLLLAPLAAPTVAQGPTAGAPTPNAPNFTVGPRQVPLGCDVVIAFSNDTPGIAGTLNCPYRVFDEGGALVFEPSCAPQIFDLLPAGFISWTWKQQDGAGNQVPPGRYWVETRFETGATLLFPVDVGAAEAGLTLVGTASQADLFDGTKRNFVLCAPDDGGRPYWLLAALGTAPGVATCGGVLPLTVDPLLEFTLVPGNGLLLDAQGVLGAGGTSTAPRLEIPEVPALVGLEFSTAFLALELQAPCPVRRVSAPHTLRILP